MRRREGFTLLEMAVVLVVIGLILGAVSYGGNLQRNATYQRIATGFVEGWRNAYGAYLTRTGIAPGDSPTSPTLKVNSGNGMLCNAGLRNAMLAAGVRMPEGRAAGAEDRFSYLDSNGIPQEVQVCFDSVQWSVPVGSGPTYGVRARNVMVITGLTPDLARFLDSVIDGRPDARFGRFRENQFAADTGTGGRKWSVDNRMAFGQTTATSKDESQVAVVTAWYLMDL